MCKFESPHKYESRAQAADSSKTCRKLRAFICLDILTANMKW